MPAGEDVRLTVELLVPSSQVKSFNSIILIKIPHHGPHGAAPLFGVVPTITSPQLILNESDVNAIICCLGGSNHR